MAYRGLEAVKLDDTDTENISGETAGSEAAASGADAQAALDKELSNISDKISEVVKGELSGNGSSADFPELRETEEENGSAEVPFFSLSSEGEAAVKFPEITESGDGSAAVNFRESESGAEDGSMYFTELEDLKLEEEMENARAQRERDIRRIQKKEHPEETVSVTEPGYASPEKHAIAAELVKRNENLKKQKEKKKNGHLAVKITLWAVFAAFCIMAFSAGFFAFNDKPLDEKDTSKVSITVTGNETDSEMAQTLKDLGVIGSKLAYSVRSVLFDADYVAGTYELSKSYNYEKIINILSGVTYTDN